MAIVPAHDEAVTVGAVIASLLSAVDRVVVVDDASTDETAAVARTAGAVVLVHTLNRGQGAALETGHSYARSISADYVLHFDADGQFDAADITPALAALKEHGADILFGSRFLDQRSEVPFVKRYLLLPVARLVHRVLGGAQVTDAHNGFRILNKKALEQIQITHDRMAHATEIPLQAKRYGLRVIEFPVKVTYREYGQGWRGGINILRDLFLGKFLAP